MAKPELLELSEDLGLTIESEFVPWSKSKRAGEPEPSLNWRVTLKRGGRPVLTTDYSAGQAHCPSYNARPTVYSKDAVRYECESGKRSGFQRRELLLPDLADVLACLATDAEAHFATFEEWAGSFGYDPDSRKAEAIYRACLGIALKLRQGLGEDGLRRLWEAVEDY